MTNLSQRILICLLTGWPITFETVKKYKYLFILWIFILILANYYLGNYFVGILENFNNQNQ